MDDKFPLMERVITGKASPEEQKELQEWISASAANRDEFEDVKLLLGAIDDSHDDRDDAFYEGLRNIREKINGIRKRRKRARSIRLFIGLVALLTALYLLFHWLGEQASINGPPL